MIKQLLASGILLALAIPAFGASPESKYTHELACDSLAEAADAPSLEIVSADGRYFVSETAPRAAGPTYIPLTLQPGAGQGNDKYDGQGVRVTINEKARIGSVRLTDLKLTYNCKQFSAQ